MAEFKKNAAANAEKKKKEEMERAKEEKEKKAALKKKLIKLTEQQRKDNLEALSKAKAAKLERLEQKRISKLPKVVLPVVSIVKISVSVKNVGTKRDDEALPDPMLGLYVLSEMGGEQWKLAGQSERIATSEHPTFKKVEFGSVAHSPIHLSFIFSPCYVCIITWFNRRGR